VARGSAPARYGSQIALDCSRRTDDGDLTEQRILEEQLCVRARTMHQRASSATGE